MYAMSPKTLRKFLVAAPALGIFGPLVLVMGLTETPPSRLHIVAYVGALATGTAIMIIGSALLRCLQFSAGSGASSDA